MKRLASYSLFLATASVISAKIPERGNEGTASPSYYHWQRAVSDMTDACDGADPASPGPEADPDDCMQFYFCTDDQVATPEIALRCDDEYKCFDPNAIPTKVCSTDPIACKMACEGNGPDCNYACSSPGIQIADENDCNKHYFCDANSDPVEYFCSVDKPYFNGHECVDEQAQCCNCRRRTCEGKTAGNLIEDTDNCHRFYVCIDVDGAGSLIPVGPTSCLPGEGFNRIKLECEPESNDCDNLCNTGGGGNTTTKTSTSSTVSATSTSSTLSTTPTPECIAISDFSCEAKGNYARCPFCDPSYFHCNGHSPSPLLKDCLLNTVFNPTPDNPHCILPGNCPSS